MISSNDKQHIINIIVNDNHAGRVITPNVEHLLGEVSFLYVLLSMCVLRYIYCIHSEIYRLLYFINDSDKTTAVIMDCSSMRSLHQTTAKLQ